MTRARRLDTRQGTFANGMEYASWGTGPKVLLSIGGGPGSSLPSGMTLRMSQRWFAPFTTAGYTVWHVTRRRGMPRGHTVADVAVVSAAAEVSPWGKEVDRHIADAVGRGDHARAGEAFAEYVLPGERTRWLRRLLGPVVARLAITGRAYPPSDVLVECESEVSFDARPALPGIRVPVILLCGDRDHFFAWDVVEETAALIPRCALIRHEGRGHARVASTKQVPPAVLAFVTAT